MLRRITGGSDNGPFGKPPLPRVPGNGVGGRVVAVGPDVDPALTGTVVVTTTGGEGGYAELALARAEETVAVPAGVDLKDAVALLADGRTALLLFKQAEIKPGERVLVEAAAGGVGSLLVQLAAAAGARVIGAARGAHKAELITSLGGVFVDYSEPDWLQLVRHVADGALDVVFDGVGGAIGTDAAGALGPGGRISVYGMASGADADLDARQLDERSIRVLGLFSAPSPAEAHVLIGEALQLAADRKLRPIVGQTYPLSEAAAAHAAIENRFTVGKTLLVPGGRNGGTR
ncbi:MULTISPECIES: zinc-binding dehydrogenase [unclassified Streptomyces]|uniref:zinc-binding dehydrogenase n=1 Tax=unclassified Streptomyces TaxID=2593676 RepID=UPI002E765FA7|nr:MULTISPECIES: zinc-binding dehydrogenase [unclassified Streptomyces]MEE1762744.1 zinc-binding dehydrogenase [Streptomyces sp. SP18BB07]MEE1830815.1 zinc-binding dehydrogenase [Streptomyces sp. SP17KL33]